MQPRFDTILECFAVTRANGPAFRQKERSRLTAAMVVTALGMLLEFFGGLWTGSLALLSDAAHMFSHLFSLGISFVAIWLAQREADEVRSYGLYRAEILAALFNGATLVLIVAWIVFDAVRRFIHPTPVATNEMMVIAGIGLAVNLAAAWMLKDVSGHDLNVKSAFFHLLSDTLSSVGILIAGALILWTGNVWFDPLASLLIALLILRWGIQLIREAVHILLESTPKHLSAETISAAIRQEIPAIHNLHHIHVWELTSKVCALTAHVVIADCTISASENIRRQINQLLASQFHITHTNLQFECEK